MLDLNKLRDEGEDGETRHTENSFVWWGCQVKKSNGEIAALKGFQYSVFIVR